MKNSRKRMSKSILSMFLVLTMLITSIPTSVFAAVAPAKDRVGSQQSVSRSTLAEGPGKENPEEIPGFEGWANISVEKFTTGAKDYLYAPVTAPVINENGKAFKTYTPELMMTYLYGEKTVRYGMDPELTGFNYITTGMKDSGATGGAKEGYLSNGDKGEDSKWFLAINNKIHKDPVQTQASRVRSGDVIRFLYSVDGGKDIGVVNGELKVNKDALLKLITEIPTEDIGAPVPGNPMFAAYRHAQEVAKDLKATQAQVDDAETKLNRIWNGQELFPATSLSLTPEKVSLAEGQTQKFDVKIEPVHTTDHVDWEVEDPSIASFDIKTKTLTALTEGHTTLKATAGSQVAVCDVTVKKVPAESVELSKESAELMMRKTLDLKAKVLPEFTTDKLVWSSDHEDIAKVDQKGRVTPVSVGEAVITATAGTVFATCKITVVPYEGPYVYFQYKDGRIQKMDEKTDSFTLSALDEGSFKVGSIEEGTKVAWSCQGRVTFPDDTYSEHYYIAADGKFVPYELGTKNASVSRVITEGKYESIQNFKINVVPSKVTELKVFVGNKEVTKDEAYVAQGTQKTFVNVKGKIGEEWVQLPLQAVSFEGSSSYGVIKSDGSFQVNNNSTITFEAVLKENFDISTPFTVTSKNVPVESFKVNVPERFAMDSWNGIFFDDFNGISPYTGFTMQFTPSYASNKNLTWKALTPDIAQYVYIHNAGIVPKKAGKARFEVSCSNPDVPSQIVEIEFYYKDPLQNAVLADDNKSFELEEYTSRNLNIQTTPGNATEKRFHWTYSKPGIVQVDNKVTNDPSSVSIPKMTQWTVMGLKPGTVTVTGTPYDTTGGFDGKIEFTVTVKAAGGGNTTEDELLAQVKDGIAHGNKYLSAQAEEGLRYGDEWLIFDLLRTGEKIDQKILDDYYATVEKKVKAVKALRTTDLARLVLALGVMGKDPSNVAGVNLYEYVYNNAQLTSGDTSNAYIWALIALDAFKTEVPADAKWTRENLLAKTLTYQAADGGFGLGDNKAGSIDMTGMALQALAPYNNDSHPEVKAAFAKGLDFLKGKLTINAGLVEGGAENSCSASQATVALTAAGMDPVKAEGFTRGPKNLVTNMLSFKDPKGGYATYANNLVADDFGTQQVVYGLESYRRLAEGQNRLYDLTDGNKDIPVLAKKAIEGIAHGNKYLVEEANKGLKYGDEWVIFSALRSGAKLPQKALDEYYASAEKKMKAVKALRTTDLARIILALGVMGKDPTNLAGVNLYEYVYNNAQLTSGDTSNAYIWALIALDAFKTEVPADAAWTREKLLDKILTFQSETGGIGLSADSAEHSVDMTGMALQALAPYNNDKYPEVQKAFNKAVDYLKTEVTLNASFMEGGAENSCTTAQVVTAFAVAGIDPSTADGFVRGPKNMITNLLTFADPAGGFATYANNLKADAFGSTQVVYALEAYRRLVFGENSLFDLTEEKKPETDPETKPETDPETKPERELSLNRSEYAMYMGRSAKLEVLGGEKGETFTWTSSSPSVAKVDKNGVVTAGKAGKTKITATAKDGAKAACVVTVVSALKSTAKSTAKSITLNWKKVSGAKGYDIYRYDTKSKSYKKIAAVPANKTSYKVERLNGKKGSRLEAGKAYRFAVRAVVTVNGKKAYKTTEKLTVATKPKKTAITKVKKAGAKKIRITWKKVKGVDGYRVYMKSSKKGSYKLIKDLRKSKSVKYTKAGLKKNKTYTFAVRTYKVIDGKKVYSALSDSKKLKLK